MWIRDERQMLVVAMPPPWSLSCASSLDTKVLTPAPKALFQRKDLCGCELTFGDYVVQESLKGCDNTLLKDRQITIRFPVNTAAIYAFQRFIKRVNVGSGNMLTLQQEGRKVILDGNSQLELSLIHI